ncbi:predicted protein [Pediculus humanus corporis]|uniref:Kinesin-like protein n=1 Tax=Pediculus humanus subsp. corporis TaxID=121224 RepID=E0VIX8_PEDHC|nr:uncharacterized protein Phum_PHUM235430 [Pediculus humanus corporis]EEB13334.1 predicted protein [Pediculus humanus corporis]
MIFCDKIAVAIDNMFSMPFSMKIVPSLVKDVLDGYNSTIFAYGASGSGKTHTMLGTTTEPGIMVRALHEIFNFVKNTNLPQNYNVTMSYLEIYNENIRDLLNPETGFLELREDQKEKTVHVVKLSEVSTSSTEEMIRLLQKGNKARTMEPTALNKTSSRSHALLSINVRQTFPSAKNEKLKARIKQGKLFMIDLAGSERASQTKNRGKRLVEGAHINRSLLALGNCINALSGGATYVNYRDSKLTRLLKDALSGNSQTCMIAHVSPALNQREESKNTLLYAERAKSISNKVEKNILDISYHVSQYRTIISELRDEIARLKSKMPDDKIIMENIHKDRFKIEDDEFKKKENFYSQQRQTNPDHLASIKNEIITTFKTQMKLRKRLFNIESYLMELETEIERQHTIISEWEGKNNRLYFNSINTGRFLERPDLGSLDLDYEDFEKDSSSKIIEKAYLEISILEKEQEKYSELRGITEVELERCKEKSSLLEKELPYEINSDEEKELLSLIIRVHELEIDKIILQSERLTKENALRQRDITILRFNRQRQICDEIITRQRKIMEDGKLHLPPDLQELYKLYQQELYYDSYSSDHNNTTNDRNGSGKLPPILNNKRFSYENIKTSENEDSSENSTRTPSSTPSSDWATSPLPPIRNERFAINSYQSNANLPPTSVLFPPITR